MRRFHILHRTYYNFAARVQLGPHRLLLRPREGRDVHIEFEKLHTTPPAAIRWTRDEYDNSLAMVNFDTPTQQLEVSSEVIVRHEDANPFDFLVEASAINYPFRVESETQLTLQPLLARQQDAAEVDALESWVRGFLQAGESIETYALLWRLCSEINRTFRYQSREQPGVQSVSETLSCGSGSCRDFARLFMEGARNFGIPARFVSGYLYAPNSGRDFGATHAWAEVYLPGAGWIGFDPTIGELASGKHIAVATGRIAESVPPVAGTYLGPSDSQMSVGVWVTDLAEC